MLSTEYDECQTEDHGCQHICVNTIGGYRCECKIGYELNPDGRTCEGLTVDCYHCLEFATGKCYMQIRGVRECLLSFPFLPIPISFNPISILILMPVKHLFPSPLFSNIHIPIPFYSHSQLPYINDSVEIVTAVSFISHSTIVVATQIVNTISNIVWQKTEINHTLSLRVKAANKEHRV